MPLLDPVSSQTVNAKSDCFFTIEECKTLTKTQKAKKGIPEIMESPDNLCKDEYEKTKTELN